MIYPKISVVTPSYNQGQFIEQTILSIINQDYPNLEYLIIDGGSTDNTVDIIKKYEDNIYYWISENDKGQSDAINKGFRKATGEFVCWINSDDILMPGALIAVADYFSQHINVDFLNGNMIRITRNSMIIKGSHIYKPSVFFAKRGVFQIAQQGMFWKRSLFDKIGYLDESYHACMDMELLIRIFENKIKIGYIDRYLGAIRVYPETKTAQNGAIWMDDCNKICNTYNGFYHWKYPHRKYFFVLFALLKIVNGKYLKDLLFILKWRNKSIYTYKP